MRISAPPSFDPVAMPRSSGQPGFTLIELMIVLFITGLIAGAVVLNLPGDRSALSEDANRFAARVAAARDEAVVGQRAVAVWVSLSGYGFEGRRDSQWQPLVQRGLTDANWRSGTEAQLVGAEPDAPLGQSPAAETENTPAPVGTGVSSGRFYFDSTGLPNRPVTISLRRGEEQVLIEVGATGEVARVR